VEAPIYCILTLDALRVCESACVVVCGGVGWGEQLLGDGALKRVAQILSDMALFFFNTAVFSVYFVAFKVYLGLSLGFGFRV